MKRIIYTGTDEDINEIMDNLTSSGSAIKKQGNSIIIFTKEESRLVNMGQSVVINKGKLM